MKLKARQIIPGWPRGRSTMQPYPNLMLVPFRYLLRSERGNTLLLRERYLELEEYKFLVEARENRAYHQAQAAMLDEIRLPQYSWQIQTLESYDDWVKWLQDPVRKVVTPLGSSPGR